MAKQGANEDGRQAAKRHVATAEDKFFRQEDLPRLYPVFGRGKWLEIIKSGQVASKVHGRAVVICRDDVERFLSGERAAGATA